MKIPNPTKKLPLNGITISKIFRENLTDLSPYLYNPAWFLAILDELLTNLDHP